MPALRRSTFLPLATAFALAIGAGLAAERILAPMREGRAYEVLWVPRGEALRFASPAIRLSFGNYYWLSAVQYVGDSQARKRGYEKLFPLVDLVTDLDPLHGYAYQTAGIVLSGEGRLDESDRILVKGIEKGPNWWSYPFYVAFNHFFYRGDHAEGARWAEIAARTPGASPNISHLAMTLKVKSGATDQAIDFLRELRQVAKDDASREALDEQYRLALLQKEFKRLDDAVARFRAAHGRDPLRLEEVVAAGLLDGVPDQDPFGGHFELRDGRVHATGGGHRIGMPEVPLLLRRPQATGTSRSQETPP